jgi:hypothetical protein
MTEESGFNSWQGASDSSHLHSVCTYYEVNPAFYAVGIRRYFLLGVMRPGRKTDSWLPSSAEVKNGAYLHSPKRFHSAVQQLYRLPSSLYRLVSASAKSAFNWPMLFKLISRLCPMQKVVPVF